MGVMSFMGCGNQGRISLPHIPSERKLTVEILSVAAGKTRWRPRHEHPPAHERRPSHPSCPCRWAPLGSCSATSAPVRCNAMRECGGPSARGRGPAAGVIGVCSLHVLGRWSCRQPEVSRPHDPRHNGGEGGIFCAARAHLYSRARAGPPTAPAPPRRSGRRGDMILIGAALLICDGIITPGDSTCGARFTHQSSVARATLCASPVSSWWALFWFQHKAPS